MECVTAKIEEDNIAHLYQSVPDHSAPDHSAPGQSAPGQSAPGQSAPNQSVPGQSVPDRDGDRGIQMTCSHTDCIIQITLYTFCGTERPEGQRSPRPIPLKKSTSGNIALIIPTQYLPEFRNSDFQRFLDGEGALQLHARSSTSPLKFVFPQPEGDICDNHHPCT